MADYGSEFGDIIARRPGPSVQEVFDTDHIAPPAVLRNEPPPEGQSTAHVSAERYFACDLHDREVEKIWRQI